MSFSVDVRSTQRAISQKRPHSDDYTIYTGLQILWLGQEGNSKLFVRLEIRNEQGSGSW